MIDPDDYWEWQTCEACGGEGFDGHDCPCGDTCCCRYPQENMVCQVCMGEGGWEPPPLKTENDTRPVSKNRDRDSVCTSGSSLDSERPEMKQSVHAAKDSKDE